MKKTVVVGFGNPLMGDEGIGNVLIEALTAEKKRFPAVDFIDLGTSGPTLLHVLSGRKKAVLIDCSFQGSEPGTIRRFKPEEVKEKKRFPHLSLHQGNILGLIQLAKQLGDCPEEIIIYGIEPEKVSLEEGLSNTLKSKMKFYIAEIKKELNKTVS